MMMCLAGWPMQAVIALCHFCEAHGPRVLFTCQPLGEGPSGRLPEPADVAVTSDPELFDLAKRDQDARCAACRSVEDQIIYSRDRDTNTTYVSTQIAFNERVYNRIKVACFRSLTIEISTPQHKEPDKVDKMCSSLQSINVREDARIESAQLESDGNVFFGDAENGYTLSVTFRLKDSRARGFYRLYSLIIVSNDMTLILHNYDFFLSSIISIKSHMQNMALRVFDDEMYAIDKEIRPQNAGRANMLPAGWFRGRTTVIDQSRDLRQITGDNAIWAFMHRHMMGTLRCHSLHCSDDALEGNPSQDSLMIRELHPTLVQELELCRPDQHHVTLTQLHNLKLLADCLERSGDLNTLLYHLITGGQVVVTSDSRLASRSILLALTNILPIGCLKVNTYSEKYLHPNRCNLLGGPSTLSIPSAVERAMHILVKTPSIPSKADDPLDDIVLVVYRRPSCVVGVADRPSLLLRLRQLLLVDVFVENVLESTLRQARDQWLDKAKLVFQLTRQPAASLSPSQLMRIARCQPKDRPVLHFWQSGLSRTYRDRIRNTLASPSTPQ